MQKEWKEQFVKLQTKVFERAPVLKEIIQQHGQESLLSYFQTHQQIKTDAFFSTRKKELIEIVAQKTESLFGSVVAESVSRQLHNHYYVSTADHHGPICHPFFLSANAVAALSYIEHPQPETENVIVFSCANVSLNNSSFPRGLMFHGDISKSLERLPLLPAQYSMQSVFQNPGYNAEDIVRLKKNIAEKIDQGRVSAKSGMRLNELVEAVYDQAIVLGAKNYDEQVSMTNLSLWKHFFADLPSHPRLIYISQESIVIDLICKHLQQGGTVISDMLLHPDYQDMVQQYFDGVDGAFSLSEKKGTYLFWGMSKDGKRRHQMWWKDGVLASDDGSVMVSFTPEQIIEKLVCGELVPSMMLTFVILSFYYGLTCLGGFYQPSYLTAMKQSYQRLLLRVGAEAENKGCGYVDTKRQGSDFVAAFFEGAEHEMDLVVGLDLFLYGNSDTWERIADTVKNISLEQAVSCLMPLFYSVLYSTSERSADLLEASGTRIMRSIGLDKTIKSCVKI